MHLAIGSTFIVLPHITAHWENNYANLGGAIYVVTANPFIYCTVAQIATFIPREKCFFQFPDQNLSLCWYCRKCVIWWCNRQL